MVESPWAALRTMRVSPWHWYSRNGSVRREDHRQMSLADAPRAWSSYACVAALLSVASPLHANLPVSVTQPAGLLTIERSVDVPGSHSLQGYRGHRRAAVSGLSITARVTASSG